METVQQNVSQNTPNFSAPVGQLKTNRGLAKYILLGIITLGIYPIVVMSSISSDINIIAGRYDGKRTMHYCLLIFLVSWLTLGIGVLVWYHNLSSRIGNASPQEYFLSVWGGQLLGMVHPGLTHRCRTFYLYL